LTLIHRTFYFGSQSGGVFTSNLMQRWGKGRLPASSFGLSGLAAKGLEGVKRQTFSLPSYAVGAGLTYDGLINNSFRPGPITQETAT
jgi:hypothetical protein